MGIFGGEFGLIKRIKERVGSAGKRTIRGIGDDAAILGSPQGKLLASIDMLVEGVHFKRNSLTPWQLGWKSLAVNISDIAAMGGVPLYALISIGLDDQVDDVYIEGVYEGLLAIASKYGVEIVGGDTVRSPKAFVIDVAILGQAENPITRSGAHPGDLIGVTGCVGNSAAGLAWILQNPNSGRADCFTGSGNKATKTGLKTEKNYVPPQTTDQPPWPAELIRAHFEPQPRIEEGQILAGTGQVSAMIDISDGLASEVNHIAKESKVGAVLYAKDIPISAAVQDLARTIGGDPLAWALYGGEDYELAFTFPPASLDIINETLAKSDKLVYVVGEVLPADQGVTLVGRDGSKKELLSGGYNHFAASPSSTPRKS